MSKNKGRYLKLIDRMHGKDLYFTEEGLRLSDFSVRTKM